jgi:hypothetical protein
MVFQKGHVDTSESDNWNVAKPFTYEKIMKYLSELDMYEIIATFGTYELEDEFFAPEELKTSLRIKSLERMAKHLDILINNTKFAVNKTEDKKILDEQYEKLREVLNYFDGIKIISYDEKNKKEIVQINDEVFSLCLKILCEIKAKINEPLNNNRLIFGAVENFDPDKVKQDLMQKMIEEG